MTRRKALISSGLALGLLLWPAFTFAGTYGSCNYGNSAYQNNSCGSAVNLSHYIWELIVGLILLSIAGGLVWWLAAKKKRKIKLK